MRVERSGRVVILVAWLTFIVCTALLVLKVGLSVAAVATVYQDLGRLRTEGHELCIDPKFLCIRFHWYDLI